MNDIFTNNGLFSDHFISELAKNNLGESLKNQVETLSEYQEYLDKCDVRDLVDNYISKVFGVLGFGVHRIKHNVLSLFQPGLAEQQLYLCYSFSPHLELSFENNCSQHFSEFNKLALESSVSWGILTDGNKWRICKIGESYSQERYAEFNLSKIVTDKHVNQFSIFKQLLIPYHFQISNNSSSFLDVCLKDNFSIDKYTQRVKELFANPMHPNTAIEERANELAYYYSELSKKIERMLSEVVSTPTIPNHPDLLKILQTINSLKSLGMSIPYDLEQKKAALTETKSDPTAQKKLLAEYANKFQSLSKHIYTMLKDKGSAGNGAGSRDTSMAGIKLNTLLDAGFLHPEQELLLTYKGKKYTSNLEGSGLIRVNLNGKSSVFKSPSGAAEAVMGGSQDGWSQWKTLYNGKEEKISTIRRYYFENDD